MEADGKYDPTTYIRRFGSWNDALAVAGFDPRTGLTEDDLLADLRQLADDLGKHPSQREMNDHGEHSHTTYVREFGSWTTALNAAFDDEDD